MVKPFHRKSCGRWAILGGRFWGVAGERLYEDCFVMLAESRSARNRKKRLAVAEFTISIDRAIQRSQERQRRERYRQIARIFADEFADRSSRFLP